MFFGPDFAYWRDLLLGIGSGAFMVWAAVAAITEWWKGRK